MRHGLSISVSQIVQFGMKHQKTDSRKYLSAITEAVFTNRFAKIHALHHVKTHYNQFTQSLESLVTIRAPSKSTISERNRISARMRAVTK